MRNVGRRAVTVDHAQRSVADVGKLMKDARRNVNGLASVDDLALVTETHFAGALDDEIYLLLLLIVPRHLAAVRLKGDVTHAKALRLNRRCAADEVLRTSPRGIPAAFDLIEVGNDHINFPRMSGMVPSVRCAGHTTPPRARDNRPTCWIRRTALCGRAERNPSRWDDDKPNAGLGPDASRSC